MVYVVERYLPGLSRSDLLRGLSRLQQLVGRAGDDSEVRYLDSTIVLPDEACYCRFEGPSEAAVAEANRRAGLPFDRIVPAVTVNPEGRRTMSTTTTTIPATVQLRRSHLLGLIGAVIVLTAAVTWAVSAFAVSSGKHSASVTEQRSASLGTTPASSCVSASSRAAYAVITCSGATGKTPLAASRPAARADSQQTVIMSLTPASLVPGVFGGYALPSAQHGPTTESVLASMSPATRRYTKMIMSLTFGQLKAGAAGAP